MGQLNTAGAGVQPVSAGDFLLKNAIGKWIEEDDSEGDSDDFPQTVFEATDPFEVL